MPSRNISSTIFLAQKSKFKVLNLPLTRSSAINVSILLITRRNVTRVEQQMISNMADCSSSSDSATSLSDHSDVEELLGIRGALWRRVNYDAIWCNHACKGLKRPCGGGGGVLPYKSDGAANCTF